MNPTILIMSDIHKGVRNDHQAFIRKQAQFDAVIMEHIDKLGIEDVFIPGDIFDRRKYVNFVSLGQSAESLFEPLAQRVKERGLRVHITPGNHDIPYRNSLKYSSLPLLLGKYDFNIYMHPTEVEIGEHKILMLPWICDENRDEIMSSIAQSRAPYCLAHLELEGFEMHSGQVATHGDNPNTFSKFHWVGSGHFHKRSSRGNINYLGATYQFTWADYKDPRGVTLLNLDDGKHVHINNPYEMFHMYYYDDEKNRNQIEKDLNGDFSGYTDTIIKVKITKKTNNYLFDTLLQKMQSENPIRVSIVEDNMDLFVDENLEEIQQVDDTPTLINKYIDSLEIEKSQILKKTMQKLYNEAITIENVD